MKTEPKRLIVTADEARALHNGETVEIWRVIRLPHHNPLGRWEPTTISGQLKGGEEVPEQAAIWHTRTGHTISAPFPPGSRWWVAESFSILLDDEDGGVSRVLYAADDEWYGAVRSPATMPRWASRTNAEVITCRVELKDGVWHWVSTMRGEKA